jgi:hypothetical protein
MADLKSKLPDLNEVMSMMDKLYTGVKNSVLDIVRDYKSKHNNAEPAASVSKANTQPVEAANTTAKATAKPKVAPAKKATTAKTTTTTKTSTTTSKK